MNGGDVLLREENGDGKKSRVTLDSSGGSSAINGPLLDIEAVAKALSVTPRHVQRLVSEVESRYLKVGRFVRFDPAELNVWLDKLRVNPIVALLAATHPGGSFVPFLGGLERRSGNSRRTGSVGVRLPYRLPNQGALP